MAEGSDSHWPALPNLQFEGVQPHEITLKDDAALQGASSIDIP